jgi:hypothetical protein
MYCAAGLAAAFAASWWAGTSNAKKATNETARSLVGLPEKATDRDEVDRASEESFPASDPPSFSGTTA